jgi:predicted lipid carrier protein YhbT
MPRIAPEICRFLAKPLQWLPQRLHAGGLSVMLNHLLAHALADGELDFLHGKTVSLEIADLRICYRLVCDKDGFRPAPAWREADVRFSGDAQALLSLATQREDADSLFFQRLLRIEGDTATGLHLKNFLDSLGEPPLPGPARRLLERLADLHARNCGAPAADQGRQSSPGRPAQ